MSHPKILQLMDRAFRLWVWGLCYSQMHLTDGYIPLAAIPSKLKASAPLLMAPHPVLWEVADGGFQVHDYGEWNDLKVTVQANRDRAKRNIAERRKQERSSAENIADVPDETRGRNTPVRQSVRPLDSDREGESEGKPPLLIRNHRNCMGLCSERICLMARHFEDFVGRLGGERTTAELRVKRWAEDILLAWNDGAQRDAVIQGDTFKWWNARYEEWQGSPQAQTAAARLPAGSAFQWVCPHTPTCGNRTACSIVAQRKPASV